MVMAPGNKYKYKACTGQKEKAEDQPSCLRNQPKNELELSDKDQMAAVEPCQTRPHQCTGVSSGTHKQPCHHESELVPSCIPVAGKPCSLIK
jgi:hypothetical protein